MQNPLSLELLGARKAAGLRQGDVAHLMEVRQSKISAYETGKKMPSQEHFLKLALIYGSAFERFQFEQQSEVRLSLLKQLDTLPREVRITADTFNRSATIERLRDRLSAEAHDYGAAD